MIKLTDLLEYFTENQVDTTETVYTLRTGFELRIDDHEYDSFTVYATNVEITDSDDQYGEWTIDLNSINEQITNTDDVVINQISRANVFP